MVEPIVSKDEKTGVKSGASVPHLFFVYNPVSGPDDAGEARERIEQRLRETGWNYTIYETTGKESLKDVVREAVEEGDYNLVAAGGGDGTVAMVAAGLVHTKVPLAIIPLGSGNVIAQELSIPQTSAEALELLIGEHAIHEIDGMNVDHHHYFLTVSVGLSTDIMEDTKREQKRRFGVLAYLWNGAKRLVGLQLRHFVLKIDDHPMSVWASEIMVVNSGILGMKMVRSELGIRPDDGMVEVCIVRSRTIIDLFKLAWGFFVLRRKTSPEMNCIRARKSVHISTGYSIGVEGDGEVIGKTPVDLEVVPNAIRVVAPIVAERPMKQKPVEVETGI